MFSLVSCLFVFQDNKIVEQQVMAARSVKQSSESSSSYSDDKLKIENIEKTTNIDYFVPLQQRSRANLNVAPQLPLLPLKPLHGESGGGSGHAEHCEENPHLDLVERRTRLVGGRQVFVD